MKLGLPGFGATRLILPDSTLWGERESNQVQRLESRMALLLSYRVTCCVCPLLSLFPLRVSEERWRSVSHELTGRAGPMGRFGVQC